MIINDVNNLISLFEETPNPVAIAAGLGGTYLSNKVMPIGWNPANWYKRYKTVKLAGQVGKIGHTMYQNNKIAKVQQPVQ